MVKDNKKTIREIRDGIIQFFNLSSEDCNKKTQGGNNYIIESHIGWSRQYLRRAGLIDMPQKGVYIITDRGLNYLQKHNSLEISDLMEYPEFVEYANRKSNKKSVAHSRKDSFNESWLELVQTYKTEGFLYKSPEEKLEIIKYWLRGLNWKAFNNSLNVGKFENRSFLILQNHSTGVSFLACPEYEIDELNRIVDHSISLGCTFVIIFGKTIKIVFTKDCKNSFIPLCSIPVNTKSTDGNDLCDCIEYNRCNTACSTPPM